jgi:DNA-binding NarL/FixJ family response regulator
MIKVVLVDDHHVVREGLKALVNQEPDMTVIGTADNGIEAIKIVKELLPNVLVIDLMMPGINGIEVTRQISKLSPDTNVVILSMFGNESYVIEALRAGAKAYVLKESTANELVTAIRQVNSKQRYLSKTLSEKAIEAYISTSMDNMVDPYEKLTTREREIMQLTVQGFTSAKIATKLYISRRTVEIHRTNLMHKLGLSNQTELIRFAIQRGMLPSNIEADQTEQ